MIRKDLKMIPFGGPKTQKNNWFPYGFAVATVRASRIIDVPKESQWLREGGRPGPRDSLLPIDFLKFARSQLFGHRDPLISQWIPRPPKTLVFPNDFQATS